MKTSTIEVGDLVSPLSAVGVERHLSTLAGVHHAEVNYVSSSATVHYDESKAHRRGDSSMNSSSRRLSWIVLRCPSASSTSS